MSSILVTGGCGYLGSRLIRDLAHGGGPDRTVRILDNLQRSTAHTLFDLPAGTRYEFVEGDVLDGGLLGRALRGVDTVVHLAAIVRTPMAFDHPVWMQQVNHWGTSRLALAARDAGVRNFVYASSTAVYGPGGPYGESARLRPIGPYATSKAGAEHDVLETWGDTATILRLGMLFGDAPSIRFEGVVNRMALLGGLGRSLPIHGTGDQTRPVVHVDDASAAVVAAVDGAWAGTFNVASASPSVRDVVAAVQSVAPDARARFTEQDVLNHLSFRVLADRVREMGWQPRHAVVDGIRDILSRLRGVRGDLADS